MIKAEVVFDGDNIIVGEFTIIIKLDYGFKDEDGNLITQDLEEAIRYCLQPPK